MDNWLVYIISDYFFIVRTAEFYASILARQVNRSDEPRLVHLIISEL